ncbi:Lrp/AsnC ligand binding domain-containing protein [Aestuariicoccus sp. MJ-SS9]|uniref:Lrp/AsnC ligand binding domain-containing protein n=1 Tax=Aestuariicoccus sp. MJ-SS9 TaxID=3079855 RepID=UPI00290C7E95|nr:Lrp/AsnC ligand binding domain-containing protein [Aestuariicoccus sp. MJ-SS9]MDU8911611.1 Lrp/AsnC ligand binding domain-containing protein [Aestuariicoccus sp. MJ-SS9]
MTGKRFPAFAHVNATGWSKTDAPMRFQKMPEVEEIHSVTGDTCTILKACRQSARGTEALLARLYARPDVLSTKCHVALSTCLKRPVQAGIAPH